MNNRENEMRYRVRFIGELLPGYTQESAILSVAKAYGVEPDEIAKWFKEGGVTLRESASSEELSGLEGFFTQHGLRLEVTALTAEPESFRPQLDDDIMHEAPTSKRAEDQSHEEVIGQRHDDFGAENKIEDRHNINPQDIESLLKQFKSMIIPKDLEGFQPSTLPKRTFAFIIDYLIVSFLSLVVVYLLGTFGIVDFTPFAEYFSLAQNNPTLEDMMNDEAVRGILEQMIATLSIWVSVTFILYFSILEKFYGATLGKKAFNIRVYSLRTGQNLSWNSAILRTILFYIGINFLPAIPFIGGILFLITVLLATRDPLFKRTLYDIVAGTVVGSLPNQGRKY